MSIYIGVDPGYSGAVAWVDNEGNMLGHRKFKDLTPLDIWDTFYDITHDELMEWHSEGCFAILERVSAMPRQGVSSTFKFGNIYGMLEMALVGTHIPFERVLPNTWQKYMKCQTKGDKNITKRKAQELYPKEKITHANADAILIARYCWETQKKGK